LATLQQSRYKTPIDQKKTPQELRKITKTEMLDLEELVNELESYRQLAKHFKKEVDEFQKAIDGQRMKWVKDKKKANRITRQAAVLAELGIKAVE
jgi:hypothetical protein